MFIVVSFAAVLWDVTERRASLRDIPKNGCEGDYVYCSGTPIYDHSFNITPNTTTFMRPKQIESTDFSLFYNLVNLTTTLVK